MSRTDRNDPAVLWERYQRYLCAVPDLDFSLDISRMDFGEGFLESMAAPMEAALSAMEDLEKGEIANPDEGRRVGHYWLRDPDRAPTKAIAQDIRSAHERIKAFASRIHAGQVLNEKGEKFESLLVIGIGGSALGPQLAADALGTDDDRLGVFFCDNTDPDGIDRTVGRIGAGLGRTLTIVISKSGSTQETRNSALEVMRAYASAGLSFPRAAVAITGAGSRLDKQAEEEKWLARFPMWDWVGGRTSELSAVGLLPAALQGIDVDAMLAGARAMDEATRSPEPAANPAALLALMWHYAGDGRGRKDMVVLPYRDRLALFSKYLQQLIMESLGKERDLQGEVVNQGIAVYGNKGSTDQHAYVQQLREGLNNFFVTFIEVLSDREGASMEVEPGVTSGDYLHGFLLGTRRALHENRRESMTITIGDVSARSLGALIALFERAVGLYAHLIDINAYHQPGVEAGKAAALNVIELQHKIYGVLSKAESKPMTAQRIAEAAGSASETETVYQILEHHAANPDRGVIRTPGADPFNATYRLKRPQSPARED